MVEIEGSEGGHSLHLTRPLFTTPDKMADFEVNRPPLHPHQKFFTNSQPLPQPAINLIYSPSRLPLRFLNKTYGGLFMYFKQNLYDTKRISSRFR